MLIERNHAATGYSAIFEPDGKVADRTCWTTARSLPMFGSTIERSHRRHLSGATGRKRPS
jgi:hypothetical protein